MKQDFPASMPRHEQISRRMAMQTPGRKHQQRAGVRANERRKASNKRRMRKTASAIKAHKQEVAAYFRGERDTYPEKP